MAEETKPSASLRNILGIKPATPAGTFATGLGAILAGVGLIAQMRAAGKMPSFKKISGAEHSAIVGREAASNAEIAATMGGFEANLAEYGSRTASQVESGAIARGLPTDIARAAAGRHTAGLSGAYAAARRALYGAKLRAQTSVQSAISSYYQNLAQKEWESAMNKYAAKMGILGTLGGITGSVLERIGKKSPAKTGADVSDVAEQSDLSSPIMSQDLTPSSDFPMSGDEFMKRYGQGPYAGWYTPRRGIK